MVQVISLHEIIVLFIDRVVGEMGEFIVFADSVAVLFCCEPGQAFFVDVNSQRVDWGDHDVDPEVEFVPVYK